MYLTSSETKELRELYNFNSTNSTHTDEADTSNNFPLRNANSLEEMSIHSEAEESIHEEQRNDDYRVPYSGGRAFLSPSAFAPDNFTPLTAGVPNKSSFSEQKSEDVMKNNEKGSAGRKKRIVKHVLGFDKKGTEHMTPAEKQQFDLEQRWKKAMSEEQRLNVLEARVSNREYLMRELHLTPNFPPKILCFKPLVHHDLETIPESRKRYVKLCFINWLITCTLLVANMCVAIGVGFAPQRENAAPENFNHALNTVFAILYLVGGPLSFIMWYWQIYRSCSTGRHTTHILSLCGLVIAFGFSIFMVVGRTSYGACGIELAIHLWATRNRVTVIPVLIMASLWGAEVTFLCYCIFRQFMYYRRDVSAEHEAKTRRRIQNIIGL